MSASFRIIPELVWHAGLFTISPNIAKNIAFFQNIAILSTSFVVFFSRTTGIVISYLYTIPLQSGLLLDWFPRQQLEPKTDDLPLRKQNMFFVEILKVKIVYPLNSDWKDRSDWLTDNIKLTSQASSSPTFVKGLCRGTISQ